MAAATYYIYVDWDNEKDGLFDGTYDNVSAYLIGEPTWERGKDRQLGTTQAGTAEFTLDNRTGLFNPEDSGGNLYGKLLPYRPVMIYVDSGSDEYECFHGFISVIRPQPSLDNDHTCYFYCVDGMEWLARAVKPIQTLKTLTAIATTSSGYAHRSDEATWADAHDAANGDGVYSNGLNISIQTNKDGAADWDIARGLLFFDTSGLGADATVVSAKLYLYDFTGGTKYEADDGHADLYVVEGVQGDPIGVDDFGDHLTKTAPGGIITYDNWDDSGTNAENIIQLNNTGIGWISKTATTKFCLRIKGDIDDTAPSDRNGYDIVGAAIAAGTTRPKLVVRYYE